MHRSFHSLTPHVLVLAALCAVFAIAPAYAAAPQTPAVSAMTPAADFLAGLTAAPQVPATLGGSGAVPLSGCTSNAQCPPKQLCCLACGFPDCTAHACFVPMNGHCPLIP